MKKTVALLLIFCLAASIMSGCGAIGNILDKLGIDNQFADGTTDDGDTENVDKDSDPEGTNDNDGETESTDKDGAETEGTGTDSSTTDTAEPGIDSPSVEPGDDTIVYDDGFWAENMPKMDGSTSTIPLEVEIRKALLGMTEEEAEITTVHSTTYGSFENLINKECDIIFSTPISEEQSKAATDAGIELELIPIAMEAFVFVVNSENPVDTLTVQQLKDIYSGKITNWKEVGGNDAEILAYQRNETSGSQNYMKLFMGDTELMEPRTVSTPHSMSGLMDVIAVNDNSIDSLGYSVYSYAAQMYAEQGKVKFIKVDGIAPTPETMSDMSYPLMNYNYAIYDINNKAVGIQALVSWLLTTKGQNAVAAAGYVPVKTGISAIFENSSYYTALGTSKVQNASDMLLRYTTGIEVKAKFPEGTFEGNEENFTYQNRHEIFGIEYSIDCLNDKTLEAEINAFISDACKRMENRYSELTDFIGDIDYANVSTGWYFDGTAADDYHYITPSTITAECVNNYLSVVVGLSYYVDAGDSPMQYYDCETVLYDLSTGKKLQFSDLFADGSSFATALNADIEKTIATGYGSWSIPFEMSGDFNGLTDSDVERFTYDSIIFVPCDSVFAQGYEIDIDLASDLYVVNHGRSNADYVTVAEEGFDYIFVYSDPLEGEIVDIDGLCSYVLPDNADEAIMNTAAYFEKYVRENLTSENVLALAEEYGLQGAFSADIYPGLYVIREYAGLYYLIDNTNDWADVVFYDKDGNVLDFYDQLNAGTFDYSGLLSKLFSFSNENGKSSKFFFSKETGEPISIEDALFLDGWFTHSTCTGSGTDANGSWTSRTVVLSDLGDFSITECPYDISNYSGILKARLSVTPENDIEGLTVFVLYIPFEYIIFSK